MTNPWISRLASLSGLADEHDRIQARFHELLAAMPRDEADQWPESTLTRSGHPVEYGLMIDRGVAVGFKYTIDLFAEDRVSLLDRVRYTVSTVVGARSSIDALERSVRALAEPSLGDLSVYWSVGHVRGMAPRGRLHIVGKGGALSRDRLEQLDPAILPRRRLQSVLAAAESLRKNAIDIVCLGPAPDGALSCKLYLSTNPYIDLRTVTRLALSLGLPTGHALSLLRWYAAFVGHHEGRLGAFGVGIDASSRAGRHGVEAYAYPGDDKMSALRRRILNTAAMSGWRLLEKEGSDASTLELAGCGVETASFARLGRLTVYLYPGTTTRETRPSLAGADRK